MSAYRHALDVTQEAASHGSAREAPGPWREAADAWEVAKDAFLEAGLLDKAEQANATAHNIFASMRSGPTMSREMYRRRHKG